MGSSTTFFIQLPLLVEPIRPSVRNRDDPNAQRRRVAGAFALPLVAGLGAPEGHLGGSIFLAGPLERRTVEVGQERVAAAEAVDALRRGSGIVGGGHWNLSLAYAEARWPRGRRAGRPGRQGRRRPFGSGGAPQGAALTRQSGAAGSRPGFGWVWRDGRQPRADPPTARVRNEPVDRNRRMPLKWGALRAHHHTASGRGNPA